MTRTDTERLEWIARTPDFLLEVIVDQPEDGSYMVMAHDHAYTGRTFRSAIDAAMNAESIPHTPDPRRERLARAMTAHSSRPWEDMNENTRKLHLAEADRLLAAIDRAD